MTTQISGTTGISQCQPGSVSQEYLAANVVGKGPVLIASMSAGQVVTNGSTQIAAFNTEVTDTNANYDPTTYTFTPTVAGYYQVNASVAAANAAAGYTIVMLYKNNASMARSVAKNFSGQPMVVPVTALLNMNGTTDSLTCRIYQDAGTSTTCGGVGELATFQCFLARAA